MTHLYLSNTACKNQFPNNKSGEFTNYLNQPLPNDCSIALNEIAYSPETWYNVRNTNNVIKMTYSQTGDYWNPHVVSKPGPYERECRIPVGFYSNVFDLLKAIIAEMNGEMNAYLEWHHGQRYGPKKETIWDKCDYVQKDPAEKTKV